MAGDDRIDIEDIGALVAFKNKCTGISQELRRIYDIYKNETCALQAAWDDDQYKILYAKVGNILAECENSIDALDNRLLPFLEKKIAALKRRPGA